MDPALLATIAAKNPGDIEAIIEKIGVATLLSLAPHFAAIAQTIQSAQAKDQKS